MKKLITFLFKKFCLKKHKFLGAEFLIRDNNKTTRAEIKMFFYDKNLNPAYKIAVRGVAGTTYISESDSDFAGWSEYRGVPPGLVDMEGPSADTDKMVQVKRAEEIKVSEKVAKKIVEKHKSAMLKRIDSATKAKKR